MKCDSCGELSRPVCTLRWQGRSRTDRRHSWRMPLCTSAMSCSYKTSQRNLSEVRWFAPPTRGRKAGMSERGNVERSTKNMKRRNTKQAKAHRLPNDALLCFTSSYNIIHIHTDIQCHSLTSCANFERNSIPMRCSLYTCRSEYLSSTQISENLRPSM